MTKTPRQDLSDALNAYLAAWNEAGAKWDCQGLARCFTEDGLFFGGRPAHYVGREAIAGYFESYIGTIASCRLELRDQEIIEVAPNVMAAQGFGEFSFVLADGARTRSSVRTTLFLQQDEEGWKARLQHIAPPPAEPPLGRNG